MEHATQEDGPVKILVVEDDPDDVLIIQDLLKEVFPETPPSIQLADNHQDALTLLEKNRFDFCLFDFMIGEVNGLDLLKSVRDRGITFPIIFLTGQGDQVTAVEAMKRGATDYLAKDRLSRETLSKAVHYAIQLNKESEQRQRAEKALRESEERFRGILNHSTTIIYLKDLEGRYLLANRQFEKLVNLTSDQIIGKSDLDIFPEFIASVLMENDKKALGESQPVEFEEIIQQNDGTHTYLSIKFPLRDSSNNINSLCGISTDITERKKIEVDLERARTEAESANKAKSIFLANMSHEIRTPLNAVLGYSQILLRDKDLSESQRQSIQTIESSGTNLLNLINDILDISKIEAGRMEFASEDFDLDEFLEGLTEMFKFRCEEKQVACEIYGLTSVHRMVQGDQTKLRQVLINLLSNAVKFTDQGKISLSVNKESAGLYCFEVCDTGPGIPPESQEIIFEPFRQTLDGTLKSGTGLGLAISKKQVELMGGKLGLDSEPGKGCRFFFSLNLPPAAGEVTPRGDRKKTVFRLQDGCKISALVADDFKENRTLLSRLLRSIGVDVIQAVNGKEAVEMVRQHSPDIILMDNRMPVMSGLEAITQIQEEFGKDRFKIVVVSASVFKHEQDQYKELGCDEFILKPFRAESVFQCLKNLLNIEYVYEDGTPEATEKPGAPPTDFSKLSFDPKLLSRIREDAESGQVSRLEETLGHLETSGDGGKILAQYLLKFVKNYDLDTVREMIERVRNESQKK